MSFFASFSIALRAWNKLIKGEKFEECFEALGKVSSFPQKRLVDLLKLAAEKGGANEFAKALQLVAKEGWAWQVHHGSPMN